MSPLTPHEGRDCPVLKAIMNGSCLFSNSERAHVTEGLKLGSAYCMGIMTGAILADCAKDADDLLDHIASHMPCELDELMGVILDNAEGLMTIERKMRRDADRRN